MAEFRNPKLAVDAVAVLRGWVVLVKRGRDPFRGAWALPGGFLEYGEPPEEGALRELEEETGLRGSLGRLVGVYGDPGRDPRGHVVSIVYEVQVADGEPRGMDDAAEAKAFDPARPPPLAFDHARILADWRATRR